MPVITRNQRKNVVATEQVVASNKVGFVPEMNELLRVLELTSGKENKMKVALEIFEKINRELPLIIAQNQTSSWITFASCVFNKINEFNDEYSSGQWLEIDNKFVDNFVDELIKTKNFTSNLIRNYNGPANTNPHFIEAKNEIMRLEQRKNLRNIPRVDYTGMDTIEPEDEFDGITDIWADLTIYEDHDYLPEEDEEDDEEEVEEAEEDIKWSKIHPELSVEEKTESKQYLGQLIDQHNMKRKVARVNYSGMDMSENDEGQIHVSKRRFQDGKVKYIWKSYSLSQANEIGDEDYVDEE